jgi:polyisoprenoid-binding protein YceI
MSGKIVVDAGSGDSGEASRDKKMKNDVLKVPRFPSVTFEPTGFAGQIGPSGTSQILVKGNFTIVGQPHEITVPMTVQIDGDRCTATGSFVVPYVQWGLKDPSIFVLKVGKEVKIDLILKGHLSPVS